MKCFDLSSVAKRASWAVVVLIAGAIVGTTLASCGLTDAGMSNADAGADSARAPSAGDASDAVQPQAGDPGASSPETENPAVRGGAAKDTVAATPGRTLDAADPPANGGSRPRVAVEGDDGGTARASGAGTAAATLSPPGAEEAVKVFPMLANEWRMWGGNPSRNMVNPFAKRIASDWDTKTGTNIKWKADLGSQSYGNPTVGEGVILVGTNNDRHRNPAITGDKGVVMCFRESDGEFLWQMVHDKLAAGRVNDWPEQGICSTPVIEDGRFYYVSNECQLVCADLGGMADGNDGPYTDEKYTSPIDGDIIWLYDMIEELGVFPHNLATSSPLVVGDKIYVVTSNGVERNHIDIPSPRSPSFLCIDKKTGGYVWDSIEPGENILHGQWSCAAYGVAGGRPQVVFPGGDGWLYSFEPEKGELIWKFDCNPKDSKWELGGLGTRNNLIATPVFYGDSVYIAVGQDPEHGEGIGNLYRIRADGQGDVTGMKEVWRFGGEDFRRTISTIAIHDGLVYASDLSGFLNCLDQETGKVYWVKDLLAAVWGSPTVIDGKVYIGDEDGDIFICKTGKALEEIRELNVDQSVYTTPVAAKGVLYIANRTTLYAIEQKN